MKVQIKEILSPLNVSDVWCNEMIDRINDLLASFAVEVHTLYPMKIIEKVPVCDTITTTTYPITKVWGFFGKGCTIWCSLKPEDCCAWYRRLLMTELYWENLDRNSYSIINHYNESWQWEIKAKYPSWTNAAFIVYSKGFPKVTSLEDEIEIDPYMLALLRTYIRSEYSLESWNDINMAANYRSMFQTRLKALQNMYDWTVKYVMPWALDEVNW